MMRYCKALLRLYMHDLRHDPVAQISIGIILGAVLTGILVSGWEVFTW